MEKTAAYIASLIGKSRREQLSETEAAQLDAWLEASDRNRALFAELQSETAQREAMATMHAYRAEEIRTRILATPQGNASETTQGKAMRKLRRWIPYAAAVLLVTSLVDWWAIRNQQSAVSLTAAEILPGGNRATLALADGRVINLDEAQTGIVIGAEDITYEDGTSLALSPARGGRDGHGDGRGRATNTPGTEKGSLNTNYYVLSTPKGGTYQVTLPDGSKVWLNAASTLTYPSRFAEDSREVILQGEAFFAVSSQLSAIGKQQSAIGNGPTADSRLPKAERLPFRVVTKGQTVDVLGTQFNISAYADDPETKTTLVEGKVKVTPGTQTGSEENGLPDVPTSGLPDYRLKPGQQATTRGAAIDIQQVDTEPYTAWRDGLIILDRANLAQVIRQIERWYDVSFDLEELPAGGTLSGEIPRDVNLSEVLRVLELNTGLTFEVTERRVRMAK